MAKKLNCREAGYDCGFSVQSETEDEVIDYARQHATRFHDVELAQSDVQGLVQDV